MAVAIGRTVPAAAQVRSQVVNAADLFRLRTISEVQLSPDGRQVAFTVTGLPPDGGLAEFRSHIRIASVRGSGDRVVTSLGYSARSPQWSPDGRRLGYIATQAGRDDIWVVPSGGGPARRMTRATTSVRSFAWAPDGRRIAFVMSDPDVPTVTARQRLVRLSSDTAPPARLWIVAIDSPAGAKAVTQQPLNVLAAPSWSPDGSSIAFVHSPSSALFDVSRAAVSIIEPETGETTLLRQVGFHASDPHFSPDGKWVAVRGATEPSPGPVDAAFYAVSVDGKDQRRLGSADDSSEITAWLPDGAGILVTSQVGTTRRVRRLSLDGRSAVDLYAGPLVVTSLHVSPDALVAAFAGESLEAPPELYVSPLADFAPKPITRINAGLSLPPFGKTELLTWKSADGNTVEGLLTYPAGYSASKPVPLLVVAHAGGETFSGSYVGNPLDGSNRAYPPPVFSSRGYAVLRVNQRGGGIGGYGFGSSVPVFKPKEKANPDILSGVDALIRMGVADSARVAIMGWSNGGLVTQSLITSSDRFAAASILAGFPDLVLESGLNPWIAPDLGAEPWENPERYILHSPVFGIRRVRAATLIIHGAEDGIPVGEARAFHGSLRKLGIPTELAVYAGMGHVPTRPSQMIDIAGRNLAWFDRYLGPR